MKRVSIFLVATLLFLGAVAFPVAADSTDSGCQVIYGGGQTCPTVNLSVTKTVLNPQTNQFVNSLGPNDPKYQPDSTVTFQLTVKNTSNTDETNVTVQDTLPKYVSSVSGNPGSYDPSTNVITFTIDKLPANQSKTYTIKGTVASANKLPSQSTTCVTDQAIASVTGKSAQDTAQFCIQSQAQQQSQDQSSQGTTTSLPVFPPPTSKTTPKTGPEALGLLALLPSAITGLILRRRTDSKK